MLEMKSTTAAIAAALIAAAPACFAQTATPLAPSGTPGSTGPLANPPVGGAPAGPFNGTVIQPGGGIGTTPGVGTSNVGTAAGVESPPASSSSGSSARGVLGAAPASPGVVGGGTGASDATGPCTPRSALDRC